MENQNDYFDWEKLGKNIQDVVDKAVNNQDYQKLNQTVRKAVESGTETIRRTVSTFQTQTERWEKNSTGSQKTVYKTPAKEVIVEPVQEKKTNLPTLYASTTGKMLGGIFSIISGGMLGVLGGSVLLLSALIAGITGGFSFTFGTAVLLGITGGGFWLLGRGIGTVARTNRFEKYVRTLGQKTYIKLEELARTTGKSVKFVKKEVRRLIAAGMFPQGHLDAEEKCLITSNETYAEFEASRKALEERTRQAELEKKLEKTRRENTDPRIQEVLDRGDAFVRQIRTCNDAIPGEEISGKISRMETIVEKIFDRARQHPEIVPDLKKLMDYYLPMTVKLLNAYADMDAQPVQGETILSSKKEIEDTLDTLNAAFEKLLDSVFKDTAMDVSSDISVLQTLLAQEGLTEDELTRMKNQNQEMRD